MHPPESQQRNQQPASRQNTHNKDSLECSHTIRQGTPYCSKYELRTGWVNGYRSEAIHAPPDFIVAQISQFVGIRWIAIGVDSVSLNATIPHITVHIVRQRRARRK